MTEPIPPTDQELKEITILQEAIKPMQDQLNRLKEKCRDYGSLCTENYVCTVSSQTSTRIASLEEVKAVLGPEVLEENDLIRVSTHRIVRVTEKPSLIS